LSGSCIDLIQKEGAFAVIAVQQGIRAEDF
jgi:hypothetical protein